jgi:hypothetical protein
MSRLFGEVTQNGYIVEALDEAISYWTSVLGIGPFFIIPSLKFERYSYNGVDSQPEIRLALANSGGLQIELIEQINDAPSYYRGFLDRFGPGLQHMSVWTTTYEDDVRRHRERGVTLIVEAVLAGGARASFHGDESVAGAVMEVLELTPELSRIFAMIREAAMGWDGADPVRRLG